jgi:hypothetical protein
MRRLSFEHQKTSIPLTTVAKPKMMGLHMRRIITRTYNRSAYVKYKDIADLKLYIQKHKNNPGCLNARVTKHHGGMLVHLLIQLTVCGTVSGERKLLQQLLSCKGVELNESSHTGESVLSLVLNENYQYRSLETLQQLLAYPGNNKLDVNHKDANQCVPLVLALTRGLPACAIRLLEYGGHSRENLQEAFHLAVSNKYLEVAAMILTADKQLVFTKDQLSASLYLAINSNCIPLAHHILELLERNDMVIDPKDPELIKAIVSAAEANRQTVIKLLFDKGLTTDVDLFPWAVAVNRVDICEALINQPTFNANKMHSDGHNYLTCLIAKEKWALV